MEDKIDKIKRLTLDDIIDNDPIAEGIYERFITINGMRKWYYRNEGIEAILKLARILIVRASEDKHPEGQFQKEYIEYVNRVLGPSHSPLDETDTFMATSVMLRMCTALPKNLERFMDSVGYLLSNGWSDDPGYSETFRKLVQELREKHYFYLIDDLTLEHTTVQDVTTVDWKIITKGFQEDEVEKQVNQGETPQKQMEILSAIEARFHMDRASSALADFDMRDMKTFFANLKKIVDIRVKSANATAKQDKSAAAEKLKEENKTLKEENQRMKAHIAKTDAELDKIKGIADDNEKKMAELVKQVEQLSAEKLDKEDDADAKNDENGVRTRRVTAAALHAILKKAMPGQKDYTFLDEAKLIAYFTNYSTNRLRTDISGSDTFNSRQATEIEKVNELFQNLNIDIELKYQK